MRSILDAEAKQRVAASGIPPNLPLLSVVGQIRDLTMASSMGKGSPRCYLLRITFLSPEQQSP
jgi:hypothetical protein